MLEYNGTIYRPPMEANTFLIPVTEGGTHNSCRFCNMYKDVPFRMKEGNFEVAPESEVLTAEKRFIELLDIPETYLWAAHSLDSTRIAGLLGDHKDEMLATLQHSIDTIDDEVFSKTFRRDHL